MSFRKSPLPRSLKLIAVGRAASFLGDEAAVVAIALRARVQLGHFGVAAVLIAGALPLVVLAAPAGLLVDRVRAKRLLVVTHLVQGAICVALAVAPPSALVALVALLACGQAVASPAWQALVPSVVDVERLPRAYGLLQSASAFASVLGPMAGGLLVAYRGFSSALVVDAASLVVLAIVALALRVDRVPEGAGGATSWREATAGVRLILADARLRAITALAAAFVLTLGVSLVAEVFFATTILGVGAAGYGALGMATGLGLLLAGATSGALAARVPSSEVRFVAGCVAMCVAMVGLGMSRSIYPALVAALLVGAGNGVLNVSASVLFARAAPPESRGRVFAAFQGVASAAMVVSMLLGGVLVSAFASNVVIVASGAVAFVAVLVAARPLMAGARELASS